MAHLRPPHGSGRSRRRRTHHSSPNPPHHRRSPHPGLQKNRNWQVRRNAALAHRARPAAVSRLRRLTPTHRADGSVPRVQTHPRRSGRPSRQHRRRPPRRRLRFPLRYRQRPHRRHRRLLRLTRLWHDHRHPHGHRRHLPRQRLDRARLRSPRHHHRRSRLHRRLQRRRHEPGS